LFRATGDEDRFLPACDLPLQKKLHSCLTGITVAIDGFKECSMTFGRHREWLRLTALACVIAIVPGDVPLLAQQQPAAATEPAAPKLKSPDELDSLVAPLALYPDPLLAQVLAASTYPLEIVQAARWLKENSKLTGENLTKAAAKQPWDPSVSNLVAFPDALKLLDTNLQWTQDLGNAFLDQQSQVMDAVQRMRKKAKDAGKLETSKEQKVEVQTVESKQVIVIQPSDPQVIYVPSYNPVVVYGPPPVYAYPPVVYPSTGAVIATAAVSFGVGVMMGAMWSGCCGGGYGWGCGWGGNNNITINNNFNSRYNNVNVNGGNRNNINSGNSNWNHNPEHRRSVPYSNKETANRVGASDRASAGRTDRSNARPSTNDRGGNRDTGASRDRGGQSQARSGGSQDRVGSRDVGGNKGSNSALGGGGPRAQTQAQSDRGFSSSRQSSGGGAARSSGGAARSSGGMSRGGGGRRR
jgi:hypothetical protein